jgi:hypothetical protein
MQEQLQQELGQQVYAELGQQVHDELGQELQMQLVQQEPGLAKEQRVGVDAGFLHRMNQLYLANHPETLRHHYRLSQVVEQQVQGELGQVQPEPAKELLVDAGFLHRMN